MSAYNLFNLRLLRQGSLSAQLAKLRARRRRGIVLLAVLVFVALLLPLITLVMSSINTEAVSTAEAIKGAKSELAAQKALNDAISLIVQEKSYPDYHTSVTQPNTAVIVIDARTNAPRNLLDDGISGSGGSGPDGAGPDGFYGTADDYWKGPRNDGSHLGIEDDEANIRNYAIDYQFPQTHAPVYYGNASLFSTSNKPYAYSGFTGDPLWLFNQYGAEDGLTTDDNADNTPDGYLLGQLSPFVNDEPVLSGPGYYSGSDEPRTAGPGSPVVRDLTNASIEQFMYNAKVNIYESIFSNLDRGPLPSSLLKSYANVTDEAGRLNLNIFCKKVRIWASEDSGTDYGLDGFSTDDFNDNLFSGDQGWKWVDNPLFPDRHTTALRTFDTTTGSFAAFAPGAFPDGIVDFGSFNATTGVPDTVRDGIAMPEMGESVQHLAWGAPGGAGSNPFAAGNTPYSVQSMYNSLRMLMALPGVDPQLAANILTYLNPTLDNLPDDFDPVRNSGFPPNPDPKNGYYRQDAMNLTPPLTSLEVSFSGGTVNSFRWDFEASDYDDLPLAAPRPLTSLEQLRDVPGMSEAKFQRLKDLVTVFSYDTNVIGTNIADIPANANLVNAHVPGDPLYRGQPLSNTPAALRDNDNVNDLRYDVGKFTAGQTLSDYQQEAERLYAWLRSHLPTPYMAKISLPTVDRLGRASALDDRMRNDNPQYSLIAGGGLIPHRDNTGPTDSESSIYNVGEFGHQFDNGTRPGAGYPALNPEFSVDSCLSILLYRNGTFFAEDDYNYSPDNAWRPIANRSIFGLLGLNFFVPLLSIPENSAIADLFTDHNNPFYDGGDNVNPAVQPHGPGGFNYAGFSPQAVYANLANPGQMDSGADLLAVPRYKFANMSVSLMADPPSSFRNSQPGNQNGIVNYYISFSDVIPLRDYTDYIDPNGANYDPDRVLYQLYFNFGNRPGVFPTGSWPFVPPGGSGTAVIPLTARNLRAVVPVFQAGGAASQQNVTISAFDSYNNLDVLSDAFTNAPQYLANEGGLGAVGRLQRDFIDTDVPRPDNDGPFSGPVDSDFDGRPGNATAGADWPAARPGFWQAFAYDSNGDPYCTARVEAYKWDGWSGGIGGGGQPHTPEVRADDISQVYLQYNELADVPFRVDILPIRVSGDQFEIRSSYGGAETQGGTFLLYDWDYGTSGTSNDGSWPVQQPGQTGDPQIIRVTPQSPTVRLRLYDLRAFQDPLNGLPYVGPAGNLGGSVWAGGQVQPPPNFPDPTIAGLVGGYPVEAVHAGYTEDVVTVNPIEQLAGFRPQITALEPSIYLNEGLADFRASSGGGEMPITYTLRIYPGTDIVTINDNPTGNSFTGAANTWLNSPLNPSFGESGVVRPASPPLVTVAAAPTDSPVRFFNDVDVTGLGAGEYWVELEAQYTDNIPGPPTVVNDFCYTVLQIDNENGSGSNPGVPPGINASINLRQQSSGGKGFVASPHVDGGVPGYSYYWELSRPVYDALGNVASVNVVQSGNGNAAGEFSAALSSADTQNNDTGLAGADGRPDADGVYFLHLYVLDKANQAPQGANCVLAHDSAMVVVTDAGFAGVGSLDGLVRTPMAVLHAYQDTGLVFGGPGNANTPIAGNSFTPAGGASRPALLSTGFGQAIDPAVAGRGDMIKLRGYNFGPTAATNVVNFAGGVRQTATTGPVFIGNDGIRDIYEISVMVPDGAETGPLSVTRTNATPNETSNQLFFQTNFTVVFDLIGNVTPGVQAFQRFELDFQGDGVVDYSFSTQTLPGTAAESGIVRGANEANLQHDYASDGIGNYNATLTVTDLISGRRQVSHQLISIRDLNPSASSTLTLVPLATIASTPGATGGTLNLAGANVVAAGVQPGDRLLMTSGPSAGAFASVMTVNGPTELTLSALSDGVAYSALVGSNFSITRAVATGGQNGMLASIWPDVTMRSETFAQKPGQGSVFRSAVGGAGGGVLRKWALGPNTTGGNPGGGGTVITSGFATAYNFTGTGNTGRILTDSGANFIAAGAQPGDFVFNESDGGSFAVVSAGGVSPTVLNMQNPNPNPAGSGLSNGSSPGRLRTDPQLRIENFTFAAGVYTLIDNGAGGTPAFNFYDGTSALNPAWRGGLVAGDGVFPPPPAGNSFFRNLTDLTTWRVVSDPTAALPNQLRVEQLGVFNTPPGIPRAANEGLREFSATVVTPIPGVPPRVRLTTNRLWPALAGVVNAGLGATVYNTTQGNAEWRVVDVPNTYAPPGTLGGASLLELEYVAGGSGPGWAVGDVALIKLPAQWAINWTAGGTDDQWSVMIPVNQWRIGDQYRVETSSGPSTGQGIGQSYADATYADLLAPVDFHLTLSYDFDLTSQINLPTIVQVAWDGNFGNIAPSNLQSFPVGDTTRLGGTLDDLEVERVKFTHGFAAGELLFPPGSPGGAPSRARYRVLAVRSGDSNPQTFGPYDLPVVIVGGDEYDTSLVVLNSNRYNFNQWGQVDFEASYFNGTQYLYASDQLIIPPGINNYANTLVSFASVDRPFISANFPGNNTLRHQAVHGAGATLNWVSDANADGRWTTSGAESPQGPNSVDAFQFQVPTGPNLMPVPGAGALQGASQPAAVPGVGRGSSTGQFNFYTAGSGVYNSFAYTADNLPSSSRAFSFDNQAYFLGQRSGAQPIERLPLAADFYIDPVVGSNSQVAQFQGYASGGGSLNPVYTYQWTVQRIQGGGGPIGVTPLPQNTPSLNFSAQQFARAFFAADSGAGLWRVSLAVSSGGVVSTCYREYELIDTPLSVNVMAAPPSGSVGDTITFFVAMDGGVGPFDVTIDYGDGNTETQQNVGSLHSFAHVYTQPSSTVIAGVQTDTPYQVEVTVTDANGTIVSTNTMPLAQRPTVDIAETIPLNVDLLVLPPSGVAPFNLQVHYSVAGGRRNTDDGYFVLLQLLNADGTQVNSVAVTAANSFGPNGVLDISTSPASDDEPVFFIVPAPGNYYVQALVTDNGGALDTASEDVFASGYLKPLNYGDSAPDVMRDREGRPMHAVRIWTDPFLNIEDGSSLEFSNVPGGSSATTIGGGRLMEADLQVLGDLFTGDPSSNFRSLGLFAASDPLQQLPYTANYSAAQLGAQAVQDYHDTFTEGRININTASESTLAALFTKIRTRRAYVLPDDSAATLQGRYPSTAARPIANSAYSAYADQVVDGSGWVDIDLNPAEPGLEQVRFAAFPPGDEYMTAAAARTLARQVVEYRNAFFDLHKPDAPGAGVEFGYVKQNYAGSVALGQSFRVDHLPVIGPWDGVNPKDYASLTRDAALLPPNSGTLHNAYDNLAGSYYNFDTGEYMFYSPTDVALLRAPLQITVDIDTNNDGVPDAQFRTSEEPSNYAKYMNDVASNRRWGTNRGLFYSGPGGWEATGLVPSTSAGLHHTAHSFDARNYFTYDPGQTTVSLNLLSGAIAVSSTGAEDVTYARNRIAMLSSNGVTAYSYIPNPPFRHIYDLYKIIEGTAAAGSAPASFPLTSTSDASLSVTATGLSSGQRRFSGPSVFRYSETWSELAGEFLTISNWLDDIAPYVTTRSYVYRVDAAGAVEVSGGSQTAVLDTSSLQRDRGKTAVIDVGPGRARSSVYTGFSPADMGSPAPQRSSSYQVLYKQE